MSYLLQPKPLNLLESKLGTTIALGSFENSFQKGVNIMTKRDSIKTIGLLGTFLLGSHNLFAQEYNFNFYNGDVSQQTEAKPDQPKQTEVKAAAPPIKETTVSTEEIKDDKQEKLKRTGISFIAGYSQNDFRDSKGLFNNLNNRTLRAGLTFVSSYDFNLDLEFLSSSISGGLSSVNGDIPLDSRIPGISLGIRNNYWLSESVGISLGGSARGLRGTLNSNSGDYYYESYGASLSAGPTFQIGKAQLLLAYEYGLDNINIDSKNNAALSENRWVQNSAIKGMLSYRF